MKDIRKNFLTSETVLMAKKRENRPMHFFNENIKQFYVSPKECSFCVGNEDMTPGTVYESPNKNCKIINNKYPAIDDEVGFHEVIIDTQIHTKKIYEQNIEEFLETLVGMKLREKFYYSNSRIKYVQIFKNDGREAGASIEHSHFQLLALNFIPDKIKTIMSNFKKFKLETDNCYLCSLKENEECFTFYENKEFKAVTMYSSLYAYSVDIISKRHVNALSDFNENSLSFLSQCIIVSLKSLEKIKRNLNFNILFYSSKDEDFHFHVKIIPRIGKFGGFELASGSYINSVLPEEAQQMLKANINN